jgi:hypothetical protein
MSVSNTCAEVKCPWCGTDQTKNTYYPGNPSEEPKDYERICYYCVHAYLTLVPMNEQGEYPAAHVLPQTLIDEMVAMSIQRRTEERTSGLR